MGIKFCKMLCSKLGFYFLTFSFFFFSDSNVTFGTDVSPDSAGVSACFEVLFLFYKSPRSESECIRLEFVRLRTLDNAGGANPSVGVKC